MRNSILLFTLLFAACNTGPRYEGNDEFFRMPLGPAITRAADRPAAVMGAKGDQPGYQLSFRVTTADGGEFLTPLVTVLDGNRVHVSVVNQIAFVQDFDLETAPDAFIADPIIGILQTGIRLEAVATAMPGSERIALAWGLRGSGLDGDLRERTVTVGKGTTPATIQFPAMAVTRATGRAVIDPGQDAFLAEVPVRLKEGMDVLTVTVRAEPVLVPPDTSPQAGDEILLAPFSQVTPEDAAREVEPHFEFREGTPPEDAGVLEVSLIRTSEILPETPLHLDAAAGELLLARLSPKPVKSFRVRAAAESGTEVAHLLSKSFLQDYDVVVIEGEGGSVVDPIIGTIDLGFSASVEMKKGEPALAWTLATLVAMPDHTTMLATIPVSIELPEVLQLSGVLRLNAPVNIVPVAGLGRGGGLALLVTRK